ncbi:low molecular weight phosphotyrosine protein phosphatase [Parabacteroides sp. 52]|uniref:low molecular weight protein-tyrosine-phosphatase n=1 Tax=unclassified Parabacteroides TaxID=2649774 RepID=UPI0013CFF052|nr:MULTISPECIES: low molecular weight protein-tyrosine-phosphatase [unclassified Parabacteroides]MDH6533668.1 protein-tyrosine phosphatase [Parabacteroides sp. PM5-20]NDV54420.1 low molecular weight phosphotyrosine protein phosphatase [Parabacteroides sp. 52]
MEKKKKTENIDENQKIRLLFVCLGNICRSPSAEAVMKKLVQDAGLEDRIEIDSAGTAAYHEGERADARMRQHAIKRGYDLESISRPVRVLDYFDFDMLIGMDDRNFSDLRREAPDQESVSKVYRMMEFSSQMIMDHVPDPYYGGPAGFEQVLDILEEACMGLLNHLRLVYKF